VYAGISETEVDEVQPGPEPIAWQRADALLRMARGYKHCNATGSSEKFLVNVHTDLETLKSGGDGAEAEIESGGIVCSETTRCIRDLGPVAQG